MPIILFLAGLQSIPDDILEAAAIDRATAKPTFWKIELPYLLPTVSMVFILALKSGLTAFDPNLCTYRWWTDNIQHLWDS